MNTPEHLPLSIFRKAWRDAKQELRRASGPVGVTAPRLRRSADGAAVVLEGWAAATASDWAVRVEVPLASTGLRLSHPCLRALQRLAWGEIRRSGIMTPEEWTEIQAAARLGLVRIVRGDGWEAELMPSGYEALRRGWVSIEAG